ncbi:MAG: VOC family protein [Acidimicrobiia bacterium]
MNDPHRPVRPQLSHVGIFAIDLDTLVPFYERMLGMLVTDRGTLAPGVEIVFMSSTPEQHHQLVLVSGRAPDARSTVNQLAFRVNDLEELQAYARFLSSFDGIPVRPLSHGNAWSLYFEDPERNRIEIYCDTPWYASQPCALPVDLGDGDRLQADTEALIEQDPSGVPVEQWQADFARRLQG